MSWFQKPKSPTERESLADALFGVIDRHQAMIRFRPDGIILDANDNFLAAMGYERHEVQGRHHRIFMDPKEAASPAYGAFWKDLAAGRSFTDVFSRVAKGGRIVWIQAMYAPVRDALGQTRSIIKVASDITARQQGIGQIAQGLQALSGGCLTFRVPASAVADVDQLGRAYNQAMERLSQALASVAEASESVDRTARDLGNGAMELSRRTEIQAATLEQTVAALHQLTSTVTSSSETAKDVVATANEAMSVARGGEVVADDAINAMSQISKSSGRISQVIGVIEDIAFQTNLLALNAGVEAARAGESGRGFAVVASEVRQLAVRSAEAAAEIKVLIEDSRAQVASGVNLVSKAGTELKKIIGGMDLIHSKIAAIASGARDQATTLSEISSGMVQLDMTTQKNAAMVDESASASRVLIDQAGALARQVAGFEIATDQAGSSPTSLRSVA